ncbi:Universal stress protein A family protein [Dioscorea alata]|uniref:Universal stress protein A family protein n=1 Tax=Dioscorea alata TaxID=55571 RepID=A0ACB7W612_DIOAL|nr:Universal stress protein A family protein [Dioscorea alata]
MALSSERNVGVAVDFSEGSQAALMWASDHLLRAGDRLVIIHSEACFQKEQGAVQLWESTGSPFIPLNEFDDPGITKRYGVKPDSATISILHQVAKQKGIEVVVKIYWGDAGVKICEAVEKVPLQCLVIGSRGLGKVKRALLGSVSSYVVHHAMCPVTVVKSSPSN